MVFNTMEAKIKQTTIALPELKTKPKLKFNVLI